MEGKPTSAFFISVEILFLVASEDAKQIEEQVDEVEVQCQGTDEGQLLSAFAHVILCLEHVLNLLAIPCCETGEDSNTHVAQDVVKSRTLQEHVYYGGDNQTNQSHEENLTHRGQVLLGGVTIYSHGAEGTGCDEEHLGNAGHRVNHEDGREHRSVQYRVDDEE